MINESFTCENCKKTIPKHPTGSARNHCPFCLFSKHLDEEFPGDRASECGGLMSPIRFEERKNRWLVVIHSCLKCHKEIANKLAPDDNYLPVYERIAHENAKKLRP